MALDLGPSWPAPEVPCRLALAREVPAGALALQRAAEGAGWHVGVTYARGTRVGRAPKVVDSIAVRLRRKGARAWAVWLDGKADGAALRLSGWGYLACGVMQLRRIVIEPERMAEIAEEIRLSKLHERERRGMVARKPHSGKGRVHA